MNERTNETKQSPIPEYEVESCSISRRGLDTVPITPDINNTPAGRILYKTLTVASIFCVNTSVNFIGSLVMELQHFVNAVTFTIYDSNE